MGPWPESTTNFQSKDPAIVSIPVTPEELKIVNAYRRLKPQDTMKISKNSNGEVLWITVEERETVRIQHNLPPSDVL